MQAGLSFQSELQWTRWLSKLQQTLLRTLPAAEEVPVPSPPCCLCHPSTVPAPLWHVQSTHTQQGCQLGAASTSKPNCIALASLACLLSHGQGQVNALPTGKERGKECELGPIQRDPTHGSYWFGSIPPSGACTYIHSPTLQPGKQNYSGTFVKSLPSSLVFWRIFFPRFYFSFVWVVLVVFFFLYFID